MPSLWQPFFKKATEAKFRQTNTAVVFVVSGNAILWLFLLFGRLTTKIDIHHRLSQNPVLHDSGYLFKRFLPRYIERRPSNLLGMERKSIETRVEKKSKNLRFFRNLFRATEHIFVFSMQKESSRSRASIWIDSFEKDVKTKIFDLVKIAFA